MKDRLLELKDSGLSYKEIRDQEGWDWDESAMGTALKRYKDKKRAKGTYVSPTPSAGGSPRGRKAPQAATDARESGHPWTQEELDQMWEMRHQDPPVPYKEMAAMLGNKRTEKAYREQMGLEKKRRAGMRFGEKVDKGKKKATVQQRRATLTQTRERAASRVGGDDGMGQEGLPEIPPVPSLPSLPLSNAGSLPSAPIVLASSPTLPEEGVQQVGILPSPTEAGGSAIMIDTEMEDQDTAPLTVRRTRGSHQESW